MGLSADQKLRRIVDRCQSAAVALRGTPAPPLPPIVPAACVTAHARQASQSRRPAVLASLQRGHQQKLAAAGQQSVKADAPHSG